MQTDPPSACALPMEEVAKQTAWDCRSQLSLFLHEIEMKPRKGEGENDALR